MIQTLKSFTRKSFKNYKFPSSISFKDKNLIFGYNGRGKSSLADEIIEEFKEIESSDSARYFNRDFIRDNLSVEDSDSLKGVIAVFGKKDNDMKAEIANLQTQIKDEKAPKKEIESLKKSTRDLMDSILNAKKGTLSISRKSTTYRGIERSVSEIFNLYNADYIEALKVEPDKDKLISMIGDDSSDREKQLVENVSIPDFSFRLLDNDELEDYSSILKENYEDIGIPNSTVIKWLDEGVHLHKNEESSERCLFCNQYMNLSDITDKVTKYKENAKQQAELKINSFVEEIVSWQDKIKILEKNRTNYELYFDKNELTALYSEVTIKKEQISTFLDILSEKLKAMEISKTAFDTKLLSNYISSINKINKSFTSLKTSKLNKIQTHISRQNELVKGAIGFAIISDNTINKNISDLSAKEMALTNIESQNRILNQKIRELKNKNSEYEDFRKFLNIVLSDLEINLMLSLGADNKTYVLKHSKTEEILKIENISEGEKNLLGLLFFYFELFEDNKQEKLKSEISLILIDDPISSLDDANKFYVLELMKNVLEKQTQIFILTHSWNDYCQLCYKYQGSSGSDTVSFLEVYKDGDSHSRIKQLSPVEKPYKQLFQEIDRFSKNNASYTPAPAELYHIPNSMRRVFEEFLHFKSSKHFIPTRKQTAEIVDIIISSTDNREIDGNSCRAGSYMSVTKKTKLELLLDITNVLSHENGHNPVEILSSAKFLMKLIKDIDPSHYNAMKSDAS